MRGTIDIGLKRALFKVYQRHFAANNLCTITCSLSAEVIHQRATGNAFHISGKILYFGCGCKLSAGLIALYKNGIEISTRGIYCCGISSGAGTNNKAFCCEVAHFFAM